MIQPHENQEEVAFNPDTLGTEALKEKLKDPKWRLENLYTIIGKDGRARKFKLNVFQRHLLDNLHWRNVILKARQLGMSTFIAILFLDRRLFHRTTKAAIVADKAENAKTIFEKVTFAWEKFNPDLKQFLGLKAISDSVSSLEWNNGSEIKVGTTIHSGTFQDLHISELGPLCQDSMEKAEAVMQSAIPTVPDPPGTFVFIESTARQEGDLFHGYCQDSQENTERAKAKDPENPNRNLHPMEYKFFFYPWWKSKQYTLKSEREAKAIPIPEKMHKYFDETEKMIGRKLTIEQRAWYVLKQKELRSKNAGGQDIKMRAEYPAYPEEAFLSSGNKLFDGDILRKKMEVEPRDPIEVTEDEVKIFSHYKKGHRYGMGADVSLGVGGDHSSIVVVDFTAHEVVATYANNRISPTDLAYLMVKVGNRFGTCIAAPEVNKMGHTTVVTLNDNYPNVYHYHIQGYEETKETERLGWLSNVATKGQMMYALRDAFQDDVTPLKVPDAALLREALYYDKEDVVNSETVRQAKVATNHFDLLIAAAIAYQMLPYAATGGDLVDANQERRFDERRSRERRFA